MAPLILTSNGTWILELIQYEPHVDIREVIRTRDVMERYKFGLNGALICCLELISSNSNERFVEAIGDHEDDSLLIDLPG
jgi:hypothetical protein